MHDIIKISLSRDLNKMADVLMKRNKKWTRVIKISQRSALISK